MKNYKLKDYYTHKHKNSVFIVFKKDLSIAWSFSGNNLKGIDEEHPDWFVSEPIEVKLPEYLYKILVNDLENF